MKHNISILLWAALTLFFVWFFNGSTLWLALGLVTLIFILITISGTSFIGLNYFVKSINKGTEKGIALTFDDGPDEKITPQILDILAKENIKATFFVIGNKINLNKDLLLRVNNEGHTIGNHTFSHTKKTTLYPTQKLKEDIIKCSNSIAEIINKKPLFFRPPYGITTPRYKRALSQLKMVSIGWSIRSLDTIEKDKNTLYKKIISNLTDGAILLFHDTQQVTLDVLPDIISYCKTNGIKIVPLPELINKTPYE
ncbi:MAG: polysaccharide deacetylase family protein [Vicingaceae bacterium]